LKPKQHFTYKYRSTTNTRRGGNFKRKKQKQKKNLNLNPLKPSPFSWSRRPSGHLSSLTLPHQAPLSQPTKEALISNHLLHAHNLSASPLSSRKTNQTSSLPLAKLNWPPPTFYKRKNQKPTSSSPSLFPALQSFDNQSHSLINDHYRSDSIEFDQSFFLSLRWRTKPRIVFLYHQSNHYS